MRDQVISAIGTNTHLTHRKLFPKLNEARLGDKVAPLVRKALA